MPPTARGRAGKSEEHIGIKTKNWQKTVIAVQSIVTLWLEIVKHVKETIREFLIHFKHPTPYQTLISSRTKPGYKDHQGKFILKIAYFCILVTMGGTFLRSLKPCVRYTLKKRLLWHYKYHMCTFMPVLKAMTVRWPWTGASLFPIIKHALSSSFPHMCERSVFS